VGLDEPDGRDISASGGRVLAELTATL